MFCGRIYVGETVRVEQAKQKRYKDRGSRQGDSDMLQIGDPVYVSAVGQLQGVKGRNWLKGVLLRRDGVNPLPTGGVRFEPPLMVFLRYLLNQCRYHDQTCSTLSPNNFAHCVKILKSRVL